MRSIFYDRALERYGKAKELVLKQQASRKARLEKKTEEDLVHPRGGRPKLIWVNPFK